MQRIQLRDRVRHIGLPIAGEVVAIAYTVPPTVTVELAGGIRKDFAAGYLETIGPSASAFQLAAHGGSPLELETYAAR